MSSERRRTKRRALVNQTVRRANKARKQHGLCECGADVRTFRSEAEAKAAKAEGGKLCTACGKEIPRVFLLLEPTMEVK